MGAEEPALCPGPRDEPALLCAVTKSMSGSACRQVESGALWTGLQVEEYLSAVPTC